MYAIVKTGGKQYRVEQGQTLVVERLGASAEGETVSLDPLLYVDGDNLVDGEDLAKVTVSARVVGHERGPKLRVVKFKPKRGYKRRTGHRQDLTRLEVTQIKLATRRSRAKRASEQDEVAAEIPAPVAAEPAPAATEAPAPAETAEESAPETEETSAAETEEGQNGA